MIGILGGMGTQAGLDFCTKLAKINRGKADQNYPLFVLYNKATIPDRKKNLKKYKKVLNSLLEGCKFLQKNKCKFISIPCNTAHYWYSDLKNKVKIPILNMPELVYKSASRSCKKQTKIGLLATDATIKTKIYSNFFNKLSFRWVGEMHNYQLQVRTRRHYGVNEVDGKPYQIKFNISRFFSE